MLNPVDYSISKFVSFADSETLSQIREIAEILTYEKGAVIETRGDAAENIYLIEAGLVQLGINGTDGSRFNLTRLGPGHTFGEIAFFLNQNIIHDANAESAVTLQMLSRESIDHLLTTSLPFSKALLSVASMRVRTTLSHIGDSLGMSLEARVAKQILSVSASVNNASLINVRQVDLAHSLGVSRVSIGKAVKSLAQKQLIDIGYGKLKILSREKLMNLVQTNERQF